MRRRGFTLVEILTVVAIIAVLAGILFPVTIAVRRRAEHTACAENLHQLGLAVTMYANDHDGWVPPATTDEHQYAHMAKGGPSLADLQASPAVLRRAMKPYVPSTAVWFCPVDPHARENVLWLAQRHRETSYFFYPNMPGELLAWPPKMQIGRDAAPNKPPQAEDVPLFCDAAGLPWIDSDPLYPDVQEATSNHPDHMVNAIRHDLSLSRLPAKEWVGSDR